MKPSLFPRSPGARLLIKCLTISLALHVIGLTFFYHNPLFLQGSSAFFNFSKTSAATLEADESDEFWQKNAMLEEVFQRIIVFSPHFHQPYDLAELPKGIALAPNHEGSDYEPSTHLDTLETFHQDFTVKSSPLKEEGERNIPAFFAPPEIGSPIASQLQIDAPPSSPGAASLPVPIFDAEINDELLSVSPVLLYPSYEAGYALNLAPQLISPSSLNIGNDFQLKTDSHPVTAQVTPNQLKVDIEQTRSTLFIPKPTGALEKKPIELARAEYDFEHYDFPSMALAAEWNDDFDADIVFLPNPEGKGYIFSISLTANYDISSQSLKQNIYFILDRSSSVQKHRFSVFKRGVLKALSSMQHGDTFNIFIIDKHINRFRPESSAVTMKNIQAAEEFLDRQEGGGLFTAGEIYASLEKILAAMPENDEVHTAILLTDGKSSLSSERKQTVMKKWIEKNNGKVSLYTAAIGRENDLLFLDLLSSISGGKLLYSDTHAAFPRRLAKLILDLKDPIAKDLMISAVPHNPQSHIEFYAANSHLMPLYSHQPYVVVGKIDEPCAFDLVIQGRHLDQWVAIKKYISFIEGHKGDHNLTQRWKAQHANVCYAKFLREGKASHLKDAKVILKEHRSEISFE